MMRVACMVMLVMACAVEARAHEPPNARVAALEARRTNTPADVDVLLRLAQTHRTRGDAQAALVVLEEAWAWAPGDARILGERGLAHAALHRDGAAEEDLAAALQQLPNSPPWRVEHARVLARLGRHAEALAEYSASQDGPPDVDAVLEHGRLLLSLRRHREAADVFHAGMLTTHGAGVLRREAVLAYATAGECSAALRLLEQAPNVGTMVPWYLLRADLEDALGQPARARRTRQQAAQQLDALQVRRETPDKKAWRAQLAWRAGRAQEAHALLEGLPPLDSVQEAHMVVGSQGKRWSCVH